MTAKAKRKYLVRGGTQTWMVAATSKRAAIQAVLDKVAPRGAIGDGKPGGLALRHSDFLCTLADQAAIDAFDDQRRLAQNAKRSRQ